jgi:hypothetical protein
MRETLVTWINRRNCFTFSRETRYFILKQTNRKLTTINHFLRNITEVIYLKGLMKIVLSFYVKCTYSQKKFSKSIKLLLNNKMSQRRT